MKPPRYLVEWSDEDRQWVATVEGAPSASWLADTPQDALGGYVERIEGVDVGNVWHLSADEWDGFIETFGDLDQPDDTPGLYAALGISEDSIFRSGGQKSEMPTRPRVLGPRFGRAACVCEEPCRYCQCEDKP